jgi:hypothetical protein
MPVIEKGQSRAMSSDYADHLPQRMIVSFFFCKARVSKPYERKVKMLKSIFESLVKFGENMIISIKLIDFSRVVNNYNLTLNKEDAIETLLAVNAQNMQLLNNNPKGQQTSIFQTLPSGNETKTND